jgi:hypothetical protein
MAVAGYHRAALVDHQRLGCSGADIDSNEVSRHNDLLLSQDHPARRKEISVAHEQGVSEYTQSAFSEGATLF